jgi:hypothetical protein
MLDYNTILTCLIAQETSTALLNQSNLLLFSLLFFFYREREAYGIILSVLGVITFRKLESENKLIRKLSVFTKTMLEDNKC